MSTNLPLNLQQRLASRPWTLPRSTLPQFGNLHGFVSIEIGSGVEGTLLIDPELEPPVRAVNWQSESVTVGYVRRALQEAKDYRQQLREADKLSLVEPSAWRLINEGGDGLPGLAVDLYGRYALIHQYSSFWTPFLNTLGHWLLEQELAEGVYLTQRERGKIHQSGRHLIGAQAEGHQVEVMEHGLRYSIQLAAGPATGLYFDQRANRRLIAELAAGKSLLNTFSYTCSFSLAAAAKGADTLSIDLSKASLQWAKENFERNRLAGDGQRFIADDVMEVLPRLDRRNERFSVVVLDPPTFARHQRKTWSTERDYARLAELGANLVEPGGKLVAFANTHRMTEKQWQAEVMKGAGSAGRFQILRKLGQDADFRYRLGDPTSQYLKGLLLERIS